MYWPIFGFYLYIGICLSRYWQNADYIPHAYLRKKTQWTKSRQLSCNNTSRCISLTLWKLAYKYIVH